MSFSISQVKSCALQGNREGQRLRQLQRVQGEENDRAAEGALGDGRGAQPNAQSQAVLPGEPFCRTKMGTLVDLFLVFRCKSTLT